MLTATTLLFVLALVTHMSSLNVSYCQTLFQNAFSTSHKTSQSTCLSSKSTHFMSAVRSGKRNAQENVDMRHSEVLYQPSTLQATRQNYEAHIIVIKRSILHYLQLTSRACRTRSLLLAASRRSSQAVFTGCAK